MRLGRKVAGAAPSQLSQPASLAGLQLRHVRLQDERRQASLRARLKRASCLATRTACSRSPPSLVRRTRRLPLAACACTAARRPPGLSKSKQLAEPPQEFLLRPGRSSVPTRSTHCAVLACTAPTGKIHTPCVEKAGQITGRRFQAQPTPNRPLQRLSKTHPTASRISAQVRETKDGGVASGAGRRDAGAGREGW